MINITDPRDCVGCEACIHSCPVQCIDITTDAMGLLYPVVDTDRCIDCHLCERVCPVINRAEPTRPRQALAARNLSADDVSHSSSGGIFILLARKVIDNGGVVFGAAADTHGQIHHTSATTHAGLEPLMRSKYVQSTMGGTFADVRRHLGEGRQVLFSGTPCQVAALRLFLRGKDYGGQLILVDVICHGVPAPGVWSGYLRTRSGGADSISNLNFRDKRRGWEKYGLSFDYKRGTETREYYSPISHDHYLRGFLRNIFLRPSCFACPTRSGRAHSDITLGDFWGINKTSPELYDRNGVSLVLVNSQLGHLMLDDISITSDDISIDDAVRYNKSLTDSPVETPDCIRFRELYASEGIRALDTMIRSWEPNLAGRILRKFRHIFKLS